MKHRPRAFIFFIGFAALGCSGITPCDNQKDLPQHIACIANPIPIERNFKVNNQSHKTLVAVIDTGIDYNHPDLMNHVHFELDEEGQPIRWGWDFVGQDAWPSPYIGRRTLNADQEFTFIDGLIDEHQPLSPYLDKRRNVVQEYLSSAWHGTSLAGLIVQGRNDIGLLAYRVVPPNQNLSVVQNYQVEILEALIAACRKAIDDGADILVMTSFFHFTKTKNFHIYSRIMSIRTELEEFIRNHPNRLFIASAGNFDGYHFRGDNNEDHIDLPAGIVAGNLLVVGSRSETGIISPFSNVPAAPINSLFYPGENKKCIYPRHMLSLREKDLMLFMALLDELMVGNESYRSIGEHLYQSGKMNFVTCFGTSFAAASAANACAIMWIDQWEGISIGKIVESVKQSSLQE